jgi:hypothetical protein
VVDVDRDAQPALTGLIDGVAKVERLSKRVHAGAIGGVERMERLQGEAYSAFDCVRQEMRDLIGHQGAGGPDVLAGRAARARELRQTADDEDQTLSPEFCGFVDGAAVVVARFA